MRVFASVFIISLTGAPTASAQVADVSWHVVHEALNENGSSLRLGAGAQEVVLRGGWSCSIGPASKQPAYEARITSCKNGSQVFEFSTQC